VLRDLTWLSSGYVTRSIAYLAIVVLLGRLLGANGYGDVALFVAVSSGIGYLAGGWPFLALPVLAARGEAIGPTFRAALLTALAGAAVTAAVLLPLSPSLIHGGPGVMLIICVYALAIIVLQGLYAVFQTRGEMRGIAATQTAERAVSLALLGAIAAVSDLTVARANLALASAACLTAAAAFLSRRHVLRFSGAARVGTKRIVRSVGPMAIVGVSTYVIASIDVLILAAFRSRHDVGVYALAYQIVMFVMQFGSLWIVATLPHHSRAAAEGADERTLLAPRELVPTLLLWNAIVAASAVAAAVAVPFVIGHEFVAGLGPLMLLLASVVPLGAYFAAVSVAIAVDRTRLLAVISVAGALINVVLDVTLVPVIGIWGPAVATSGLNVFAVVVTVWALVGRRTMSAIVLRTALPATALLVLAISPRNPFLLALLVVAAAAETIVSRARLVSA
jgi:O-antigen/teichoic acid export membrane protein